MKIRNFLQNNKIKKRNHTEPVTNLFTFPWSTTSNQSSHHRFGEQKIESAKPKNLARALLVDLITCVKAAEIESKAMVVQRGNQRELRLVVAGLK